MARLRIGSILVSLALASSLPAASDATAAAPKKEIVVQAGVPIGGVAAISPDGNLIANCGYYGDRGDSLLREVTVWNRSGILLKRLRSSFDYAFRRLEFDSSSRLLAVSGVFGLGQPSGVELWNLATGESRMISTPPGSFDAEGVFDPRGSALVVSYTDKSRAGRVAAFDTGGATLWDRPLPAGSVPYGISFFPEGDRILLASAPLRILVMDLASGKVSSFAPAVPAAVSAAVGAAVGAAVAANEGAYITSLAAGREGAIAAAVLLPPADTPFTDIIGQQRFTSIVCLHSSGGDPEGSLPPFSAYNSEPVSDIAFSHRGDLVVSFNSTTYHLEDKSILFSYSYRLEGYRSAQAEPITMASGEGFAGRPSFALDGSLAIVSGGALTVFDPEGRRAAAMGSGFLTRRSLSFSPDGRRFVCGPWPCELWSVDGRLETPLAFPESRWPFLVGFSPAGEVVGARADGYDLLSLEGELRASVDVERTRKLEKMALGGSKLFLPYTEEGGALLDLTTGEVGTFDYGGRRLAFSADSNFLVLYGENYYRSVEVLDAVGASIGVHETGGGDVSCAAVSNLGQPAWIEVDYGRGFASASLLVGGLAGMKTAERALQPDFDGQSAVLAFSPVGDAFALASGRTSYILVYDHEGNLLRRLEGHGAGMTSLAFSADGRILASASADATMRLWNLATGDSVALASEGRDWIAFTDDGYFDASPSGGRLVALVEGLEARGIEQEAVSRNRPDILLSRLGVATPEEIAYYRGRYVRRLAKAKALPASIPQELVEGRLLPGSPPGMAALLAAVYSREGASWRLRPEAPVDAVLGLLAQPSFLAYAEEALQRGAESPRSSLRVAAASGRFADLEASFARGSAELVSYNVYVDDVPLFPGGGKALAGGGAVRERIELEPGRRRIEVSCRDASGAESTRTSAWVEAAPEARAGRGSLYLVAFGVSDYRDGRLSLLYPRKDVQDLAQAFRSMEGYYDRVHVHEFVDGACDRAAVSSARALLGGAGVDDTVVLFISGHGVHDSDPGATYYFLTSETSVGELSSTAADFEFVEGILDGIAPRKKLFLMDTCESGEYEGSALEAAGSGSRGVRTRSIAGEDRGVSVLPAAPPSRALARDRYVNNDIFRRTGAIVFSSSRGGELSYEPGEYLQDGNGFFTGAVLRALGTVEADSDGDGMVSVDELKAYVPSVVARLTGGLQHPTVDRDNLSAKFGFPLPASAPAASEPGAAAAYLARVAARGDEERLRLVLGVVRGQAALDQALLAAAKAGKLGAVKLLLSQGADPRARDGSGASAARLAAEAGSLSASMALAEAGSELPASLVAGAEAAGSGPLLEALVRKGVRVERDGRQSALWRAIEEGSLLGVRLLVEAGVELEPGFYGPSGLRPADAAKALGQPTIAAFLERQSALSMKLLDAVSAGDLGAAARLVDSGAPINSSSASSPLVQAAAGRGTAMLAYLLERGAEIDAPFGPDRITALMAAARDGTVETAAFLLDAGADPGARDAWGKTALGLALAYGREDMAAFLRSRGISE